MKYKLAAILFIIIVACVKCRADQTNLAAPEGAHTARDMEAKTLSAGNSGNVRSTYRGARTGSVRVQTCKPIGGSRAVEAESRRVVAGENPATPTIDVERMADAIYRAEGGDKARVPYGVLSIKVKDKADARRICLNSIRNNIKRWDKAGRPGTFINFMSNRWCPSASDPVGNRKWKRNVTLIYDNHNI